MKYIILSITESDFEVFGHEVEFGEGKKYPPITIELDKRPKGGDYPERLIEWILLKMSKVGI